MCGRFNLTKPKDIEARFGFPDWHAKRIEPRFNIAPTQEILTVVQPPLGAARVQVATWGFAPFWLKRRPPINARAETLPTSPLFRESLATLRCLIPATGFYEWQGKTPMHIQLTTGDLFAFAGLWVPGSRGGPPSAAIVTTTPNDLVAHIHNRMPVILRPEDEALWLDPSVRDVPRVLPLLKPLAADQMRAYQVAPLVNWFENDGPALIEPA